MSDKKFPKLEDIQKEFEDFIHKRFGDQVQIFTHEIPMQKSVANQKLEEKKEDDFNFEFDYRPKDLKAYLDRFIIGQDEAKKTLSIAICDHYNQLFFEQKLFELEEEDQPQEEQSKSKSHYQKQNVLILGPTGVGKTYMIRQLANLIGVPFVRGDATRFSETGYMGANVEDLIKDLVQQADGNISKAEWGIIYLDEADKLATQSSFGGRDVSGRGVQLGLLKLMEETEVDLRASYDPASQMQAFFEMQQKGKVEKQIINTKHILFIVSGAFTGIEDIIAKRLNAKQIGFANTDDLSKNAATALLMNEATTKDFVDYGFEPEFIGRLPVRVACHHLDEDSLYSILKNSEGSIIHQYVQCFRSYGIDFSFQNEALKKIAKLAVEEKTGARGLFTQCEKILRHYKYHLPSTNISKLEFTAEMVDAPLTELERLLTVSGQDYRIERKQITDFIAAFSKQHQMELEFHDDAFDYICEESRKENISAHDLCKKLLQSFEYGLKLIEQNTGKKEFLITRETLCFPKVALEKMVLESYRV